MTTDPPADTPNEPAARTAAGAEQAPQRLVPARPLGAVITDTFRWLECRAEPGGGWRPESGFATTVSAHVAADQKVPVLLLTMRREGGRAATGFLAQRSGLDPRRL